MSQVTEDILDGLMCQVCGAWMEDIEEAAENPPGHPRTCEDCKRWEEEGKQMKVSEAIDQLNVGDKVWVKGVVDVVYQGLNPSINIREVGWFFKNTEISLTEPQAEKVEVPDFIAKLIRKYKAKKETLVCSIANLNRQSDEYKWYVDNAEIYERAWVNGYTVKPKRWVVKFRNEETDFYFIDWSDIYRNDDNPFVPNGHLDKSDDSVFIFTDKSKAEAVATLVEGQVEEVAE